MKGLELKRINRRHFDSGIGVEKDEHKAFIYFQESVAIENDDGAHNLGKKFVII